MGSAAGQLSSQTSANGSGPHDTGPRLRRAHTAWWIAAVSLVLLLVTGLLFTRQAVEHGRVQQDLDVVAAAFTGAREANAREYAPDKWLLATSRMDEAMAELHRQEGRFVLIRSYPRVHELLVKAIDAAEVAKATADTAQTAADEQGQHHGGTAVPGSLGEMTSTPPIGGGGTAIDAVRVSFDIAVSLLARVEGCPRAAKNKQIKKDLETVSATLEAYRAQLAGIRDRLSRGDVSGARRQAEELKDRLDPLAKDLESIRTKFKCR